MGVTRWWGAYGVLTVMNARRRVGVLDAVTVDIASSVSLWSWGRRLEPGAWGARNGCSGVWDRAHAWRQAQAFSHCSLPLGLSEVRACGRDFARCADR